MPPIFRQNALSNREWRVLIDYFYKPEPYPAILIDYTKDLEIAEEGYGNILGH